MFPSRVRIPLQLTSCMRRMISTLPNNPHIKAFPDSIRPNVHLLTLLDTSPPSRNLAIGETTEIPPTPRSFSENPRFLRILNLVLQRNAHLDEDLRSQARAFASPGGATFGSGGVSAQQQQQHMMRRGSKTSAAETSAGGASAQGGAGGGGVGGWVHLSDTRNPPDFGRIAWPEDILGSVEVDSQGNLLDNFQPSGTYRIVTNEGILGLSQFLRERLIQALKDEERKRERI